MGFLQKATGQFEERYPWEFKELVSRVMMKSMIASFRNAVRANAHNPKPNGVPEVT